MSAFDEVRKKAATTNKTFSKAALELEIGLADKASSGLQKISQQMGTVGKVGIGAALNGGLEGLKGVGTYRSQMLAYRPGARTARLITGIYDATGTLIDRTNTPVKGKVRPDGSVDFSHGFAKLSDGELALKRSVLEEQREARHRKWRMRLRDA